MADRGPPGAQQPLEEVLDQTEAADGHQEQQLGGGGGGGGPPLAEQLGDDEWVSQDEEEGDWPDDDEEWIENDEDNMWWEHDAGDMQWELEEWDEEEEEEEAFGSESSDEPAAEEAAAQRLAEETAGRRVERGWASYAVQTTCHHFQSADALAVAEDPSGSGALLAAVLDQHGLSVWLLPAAGSVVRLGASEPRAVRLGGFQVPREAYALAWAARGTYVATGGEGGLLSLYSVHPEAPARPVLPAGRVPTLDGLNFFFTPLLMPVQLRRLHEHLQGQMRGGGGAGAAAAEAQPQGEAQQAQQAQQQEAQQAQRELPRDPVRGAVQAGLEATMMHSGLMGQHDAAGQAAPEQQQQQQQQQQLQQLLQSDDAKAMRGFLRAVLNQDIQCVSGQVGDVISNEEMQAALARAGTAVHRLTTAMAAGHNVEHVAAAVAGELPAVWPPQLAHQQFGQQQGQAAEQGQQQQQQPDEQRVQSEEAEQAAAAVAFGNAVLNQDLMVGQADDGMAEVDDEEYAAAQQRLLQSWQKFSATLAAGASIEAGNAAAAAGQGQQQQEQQADGKGKQPAEALAGFLLQQGSGRQQQQQQQQEGSELADGRAALMLRASFALGFPNAAQAKARRYVHDGMTNGVRCGRVAGQERLLAAEQSGYVYIFESPANLGCDAASSSSSGTAAAAAAASTDGLRAQQLLCAGLGGASPHWRMRPVNLFDARKHALGASLSVSSPPAAQRPVQRAGTRAASRAAAAGSSEACVAEGVFHTAALGPFPVPINLAVPSPDGRWVAVVGDTQAVFVADQAAGFAWRQLPFDLAGSRDLVEQGIDAGSQYAAWNASSSLLAVSSDALHAVFVFEPASGQLVMRVEGHAKPCLSLGFAPWDDHLLAYAEEAKHVHLRRVPAARQGAPCCELDARDELADVHAGAQLLRLPIVEGAPAEGPAMPPLAGNRRRRVNGLALSAQGDLLVATRQSAVLRFLSAQPWASERHADWPPAFRAAARTLLLAAQRQAAVALQRPDAAAGLWTLPLPLLQHILELAAGRRTDWLLPPAAAAPAAGAGGDS